MYNIQFPNKDFRLLFLTDIHLTDREFKGTDRYVEEQEKVILRIIEGAENGKFDGAVIMGDLFDTTYKSVDKTLYHVSLLSRLNKALNGFLIKVLGNHTLNKGKAKSLSMFMAGKIHSKRVDDFNRLVHVSGNRILIDMGFNYPILNVTDRLFINQNVVNLFHFNRYNKNYTDDLSDLDFTVNKHIGVYHDSIVSSHVRNHISMLLNDGMFQVPFAVTTDASDIFYNIDWAVIGDIHTRIGEFVHVNPTNGKQTIVDIPGSLGRTQNSAAQHHNFVNLPLFTFSKEGDVKKSHMHFELLDHKLLFKSWIKEERNEKQQRLNEFNGAMNLLVGYDTPETMLEAADIDEGTKALLRDLFDGNVSTISYRATDLYRELM